jgi:hypothetical protein
MQKTYLFSLQIGMPQANALNSIGYMDCAGSSGAVHNVVLIDVQWAQRD